jgi:hypothetical protein
MPDVLPTNVRLGIDQHQVTGVYFNSVTGKYWPILRIRGGSTNDLRALHPGETRGIDAQRCEFNDRSM